MLWKQEVGETRCPQGKIRYDQLAQDAQLIAAEAARTQGRDGREAVDDSEASHDSHSEQLCPSRWRRVRAYVHDKESGRGCAPGSQTTLTEKLGFEGQPAKRPREADCDREYLRDCATEESVGPEYSADRRREDEAGKEGILVCERRGE